jgi:hypothetical protein
LTARPPNITSDAIAPNAKRLQLYPRRNPRPPWPGPGVMVPKPY